MKYIASTLKFAPRVCRLILLIVAYGCGHDEILITPLPNGLSHHLLKGRSGTIETGWGSGRIIYPLDSDFEIGGDPYHWECNEVFPLGVFIVGKCIKRQDDPAVVLTKYFVIDARHPEIYSDGEATNYVREFDSFQGFQLFCNESKIQLPEGLIGD